jgi:hypothetical protein
MSRAFLRHEANVDIEGDGNNRHATTEKDGHTQGRGERREAGRVGETRRRLAQIAHLKAKPSLSLSRSHSRSLATLVTPTTSTPVQDNISLIPPRLCSILHQPIWAGARSDKFTSRLTVLAGPKHRQLSYAI